MYIKLKIEGELLELLKAESQSECRTCTQQALYIIKSHYKTKEVANNSDKELIETNKEFIDLLINYDEILKYYYKDVEIKKFWKNV